MDHQPNPNYIVPTAPPGTSNNQAASTAFVAGATGFAFTPEQYGAVGDGITDDTLGLNNFFAALGNAATETGRAYAVLSQTYMTTASVSLKAWTGTVEVDFIGGAQINFSSNAANVNALQFGAEVDGAFTTITANTVVGANTLAVGSTVGLAKGGYIFLVWSTGVGNYAYIMLNRILAITDGTHLTLEKPLSVALNAANAVMPGSGLQAFGTTPYISTVTMVAGRLILNGARVIGQSLTGTNLNGVYLAGLSDALVTNTHVENFSTSNSGGVATALLYNGVIKNTVLISCGSAGQGAFSSYAVTGTTFDTGTYSFSGFAMLNDYTMSCKFINQETYQASGRGIKIWGGCGNLLSGIVAQGGGFTGFDFDSTAAHNRGSNISVMDNEGGISFLGTGAYDNIFSDVFAENNTAGGHNDIESFGSGGTLDINNRIIGLNTDATIAFQVQSGNVVDGFVLPWTPTITATSTAGTPVYSVQEGSYIQLGNLVTAWFNLQLSGWTGSPAGNVQITGLPVASSPTSNDFGNVSFNIYVVSGLAAGAAGLTGVVDTGVTTIEVKQSTNTGVSALTAAQAGTTPRLIGMAQYHV